jgi:hypothetical protein
MVANTDASSDPVHHTNGHGSTSQGTEQAGMLGPIEQQHQGQPTPTAQYFSTSHGP